MCVDEGLPTLTIYVHLSIYTYRSYVVSANHNALIHLFIDRIGHSPKPQPEATVNIGEPGTTFHLPIPDRRHVPSPTQPLPLQLKGY